MMEVVINYWAVLVAALCNMVLGYLWYGPLFGKKWMALMGITPQQTEDYKKSGKGGMNKQYTIAFLAALIMNFVLAHAVIFAGSYLYEHGMKLGLMVGFANWIGFVVPVTLGSVLWEKKSWSLWFINAGYYLVLLLITGTILAVWI